MAEKYRFFDSVDGEDERFYTADEFAEYFRQVIATGILNGGTNLKVTSTETDMSILINEGYAWLEGYLYKIEIEPFVLTLDAANPARDRIDRIVIRLDKSLEKRYVKAFVLKGQAAEEPIAPELTRDDNVYELSLAQIRVIAGKSFIHQSEIIDERLNTDVCGMANSLITADTTEIFNQFQDWYALRTAEYELEWDTWETQHQADFKLQWQSWFENIQDVTNLVTKVEFVDEIAAVRDELSTEVGQLETKAEVENKLQNYLKNTEFESYKDGVIDDIIDVNDNVFKPKMKVQSVECLRDQVNLTNVYYYSIFTDEDFLYLGGSSNLKIYNKHSLELVSEHSGVSYANNIAEVGGSHLYTISGKRLNQYNKETLVYANSLTLNQDIKGVLEKDNFVYIFLSNRMTKYDVENLSEIIGLTDYPPGSVFNNTTINNNKFLLGLKSSNAITVYEMDTSDLTLTYLSGISGSSIRACAIPLKGDWLFGDYYASSGYSYSKLVNVWTRDVLDNKQTSIRFADDFTNMYSYNNQLYFIEVTNDGTVFNIYDLDTNGNLVIFNTVQLESGRTNKIYLDDEYLFITIDYYNLSRVPMGGVYYYNGVDYGSNAIASSVVVDYGIDYLREVK